MTNAQQYFKNKDKNHFDEIKIQASSQSLSGWEEYYWAGLYLNEYAPDGTYNELIVETLEESFFEGLTYLSNRSCYLDVVRVLGKLYLELQQYDLALNMFQMLIIKDANVPEWVYLRYAYAQLHSDTVKRFVDEPEYLFSRLDHVADDISQIGQRNAIFQEFLEICVSFHRNKGTSINTDLIFDKAQEYGLLNASEWKMFAKEFENIFGKQDDSVQNSADEEENISLDEVVIQEHLSKESKERISGFFQNLLESYKADLTDDKKVQGYAADMLAKYPKEKNIIRLAAMEGAISTLSVSIDAIEMNQKISFSNACKILVDRCGFGEAVAIDFCVEIARAFKFTIDLETFDTEDNDVVFSSFADSLVIDLEQENTDLMNKIHELQAQMSILVQKNQDYALLLEEKKAIIEQLTANEECIDNIAKGAANGITNGHDLLSGNRKILVIGQPMVSTDKLQGIVKSYGYEKNDFVFWDDYDKIKSYAERMAGGSFSAIIAGPMPHKVSGLGDYSSLIEKMRQPGYPYLQEARTESGELKISKSSFKNAVESITKHLLAIQ